MRAGMTRKNSDAELTRESVEQDAKNLSAVRHSLDPQQIKAVAERMHSARRILILGGDAATALVVFLEYSLTLLGLPVFAGTGHGRIGHLTRSANRSDLVLAISFRRGLRMTVEGLEKAREKGAYCVAIADTYETSFGVTDRRRILLMQIHSGGISGWGECTATEGPFYISETIDTAWLMLHDFLIPRVLGKTIESAREIPALLAPIRGNEMAKAVIETAAWHLESVARGVPLWRLVGGTMQEIACGVSLGIQPTIERMLANVEREVAAGYQRIKLKIKPGKDIEVLREVRRHFPHIQLSVDANSAYSLADTEHLKRLDEFRLLMMEQPLEWDDMADHARLQRIIETLICLDESIHHLRHAQAAVGMGACRVVNIKLGRVGGHAEASRIQSYCASEKIPVWCGGMIESGIGRAHNIAMSTQPGFIWPGDVSASRRYWDEDIIDPEVEVTPRGTIRVPQLPGLGYAVRERRVEELTVRRQSFSALPESVALSS